MARAARASHRLARRTHGYPRRVTAALQRQWFRDLVAFTTILLLTGLWFQRLIPHLGNAVLYGPNDETYSIRLYWAADYFKSTPFTLNRDILNGWPEGLPIPTAVEWANLLIPGTIWALHYVMSITAAENVFLLGGFVLTGFSVYLLLDRLGFHPMATAYAAYAAAFNPWMFERAGAGHHGFMQAWVFTLQIATLLHLHQRRTFLAAALAGLALAISFYESSYYGLLGSLLFAVFLIVDFATQPSWRDRLYSFTLADISAVAAVVAFTPALLAWWGDRRAVSAGVSNPVQEVQNGGASLASYLMPGTRNPFLGGITRHFYPRANYEWSENTLYLGWSLIGLGIIGAVLVIRRHSFTTRTPAVRYFLVAITTLAPAAFIFSLKRKTSVLGVDLPMPSYFLSEITTFWRVFARFGYLVTFTVAILAAVALDVIIRRHRRGLAMAAVAFAALVFEHAIGIPTIYQLTPPPAWVAWLKNRPFGSVANYPLPTDKPQALTLLAESYFNQKYDLQPQFMLFGSGYGQTREDAIRILARYVNDPLTPSILKASQVKYVLLHDNVYRSQGETPPKIPKGMHLVARLPGVRALELDASVRPANLAVVLQQNAASIALVQGLPVPRLATQGFERSAGGALLIRREGILEMSWKDPRLAVLQLLIRARSSGGSTVQLLDAGGAVTGQANVGEQDTQLVLGPANVSGLKASFRLRVVRGGPVRITSLQIQPVANVTKSIRDVR